MAESHIVSGLVSKRAEVAGQIASFKSEIIRLQGALSHLDGSIKLFVPEFDLRTVKAKRTNKRNTYFKKGEAQRMTLDVLREEGKPLSSREITDRLLKSKNIESNPALVARIQKNVIAVLHRQDGHLVRQVEAGGALGYVQWIIA
ncbi:hypothetical protein QN372_18230 [Undibacterium sp. RTI2.1]|uniref:hypothetical protein n=1 Tax=unclassified Undibacterium TaxID=2630295 RepID=UPI002B22BCE2|nr:MULTISPECIES: hypothetical protein [unclassified Undibacterium]MEB0032690.1 hypothetical protein [Undibacterium sp. RTI2.1]MEB0118669.1 hypothetical protein [Undibacterium sp. RTI2.2]